jgi:hypothetical protein
VRGTFSWPRAYRPNASGQGRRSLDECRKEFRSSSIAQGHGKGCLDAATGAIKRIAAQQTAKPFEGLDGCKQSGIDAHLPQFTLRIMSRHPRSTRFTAGAQHVLAPAQLPSVKWLSLILLLLLVASFCFVGGAAWQRLKDRDERREERLKQDLRFDTIDIRARPEKPRGDSFDDVSGTEQKRPPVAF